MLLQIARLCLAFWIAIKFACAASVQLHPKFHIRPNSDESTAPYPAPYSSAGGKSWVPTSQTIFYQTESSNSFTLEATIENAPSRDLQIEWHYRCRTENESPRILTQIDRVKVCEDDWHIDISAAQVSWTTPFSVKLLFEISLSKVVLANLNSYIESTQTLSLIVTFFQGKMQLLGRDVLIRKWHWVGALFQTGMFNLTETAKDVLIYLNTSSLYGFGSVPLYEAEAYNFVTRRSGLRSSILSFGFLLQLNAPSFRDTEKHLRIMTSNYPWNLTSLDLKSMRVFISNRHRNIMLHYSHSGLKRAAAQLLKERPCSSTTEACVQVSGCQLFFNIWLPANRRTCTMSYIVNREQYNLTDNELGSEDCTVVNEYPAEVSIFAGAAYTVPCPIICSRQDTQYLFFKGSERMQTWLSEAADEFVPYGAVSVHRSGVAIVFDKSATYADSGEYRCIAGVAQATFNVEVVALPVFNVSGTELVGGYLPPKIYLFEGDKYSVNCTVFHASMHQVTLSPWFFVVKNRSALHDWSALNQRDFVDFLATFGSHVDIRVISNLFSTTLALTVDKVPQLTNEYDYSHRFLCLATVSNSDAGRFGLPSYETESGSDVLVLQPKQLRPVPGDFTLSGSGNCCREKCPAEKCTFEISLKPSIFAYLMKVGIKVHGEFFPDTAQTTELHDWIRKSTEFSMDKDTANLKWRMSEDLDKLSKDKKAAFFGLVAVFTFVNPTAKWGGIPAKLRIDRCRSSNCSKSGAACSSDPSCVFSTATDPALNWTLTVRRLLKLPQAFLLEDYVPEKSDATSTTVRTSLIVIVGSTVATAWYWWSRMSI